jgi:hypothetical protein
MQVYGYLRTFTLCALRCAWIAPCSTRQAPHRTPIALCSTLAFRSDHRLLRVPHSMPCVARGLLRAQHLEFRTGLVVQLARYFPLRPVRGLLLVRDLDLLLSTDISALNPVFLVLTADRSVLNTYCSASTFYRTDCYNSVVCRGINLAISEMKIRQQKTFNFLKDNHC